MDIRLKFNEKDLETHNAIETNLFIKEYPHISYVNVVYQFSTGNMVISLRKFRQCGEPNLVGGLEHGFYSPYSIYIYMHIYIYWECMGMSSSQLSHILQRGI